MSESPVEPRAKRQKIDKKGRFAALSKLKELKGSKNKYEIKEDVDNVYDIVDEREYSKRVLNRAADDWIDDDGTGYVEDGREIFDDDSGDEEVIASKSSKKSKNQNKRFRDTETPVTGKGSLRNLFAGVKRKEAVVNLKDDDILADILEDIKEPKSIKKITATVPTTSKTESRITYKKDIQTDANAVKEYMESFSNNLKKKIETKNDGNSSDDDIVDRILKPDTKQNTTKVVSTVKKHEIVKRNTDVNLKQTKVVEVAKRNLENESIGKKEIVEIKSEKQTPTKPKSDKLEDNQDDLIGLDLSCFDDEENQIIVESEPEKEHNKSISKHQIEEVDEKLFLTAWNDVNVQLQSPNDNDTSVTENNDLNFDSASEIKMWYWDAWEDPHMLPGQLYLFGRIPGENKSNEYKSTCIHIQSVERCLFLLPREFHLDPTTKTATNNPVKILDVYEEFDRSIATELNIKSFRTRKVVKKFPFNIPDVDIPDECEYLEVRYTGKSPAPKNKKTYKTIAHIFGTNTNSLETFILEKKIKGPCWLNIKNFAINERAQSFCKLQLSCPDTNSIQICEDKALPPVPLTLLTINLRTALNPKTTKNEIVMIGCLVNDKFSIDKKPDKTPFQKHFCGFTRPALTVWPTNFQSLTSDYKGTQISKFDSERVLLSWFLTVYQKIDPDLIITHDANDCQLDVLCDRVMSLKISLWSRLGRLRKSNPSGNKFKDFMIGRMVCDIKASAEELIKSKSYDLETLCTTVLKIPEGERMDVSNADLFTMYETGEGILKLISLTMQDCLYTIRLMCELNVLPLALQITTICGNLMSRTLQGGRSERNEFYLLHAFTEKDFIVPDKKVKEHHTLKEDGIAATKKKAAYAGGLVLDPIKGYYDSYILLMDFNSLYPSIIQEYNICFTTVLEPLEGEAAEVPASNTEPGILPRQIRRLVESRREVKKLMEAQDIDTDVKMQYNIRQLALKLTANSMYGCLGFGFSRFYAQHLAALVTQKGREILMNTKSLVQKLNYEVVYGDTDSIMVNTNVVDYDQVYKIGSSIKQAVNKIYKQVELDIDGVFKRLLLLKKKKYAALTIEKDRNGKFKENQELKGLDIVRRDWSQIAVIAGRLVVNEILSDNQMDAKIENISAHLEKFGNNLREGKTPLPTLIITKQLTKAPKDYTNLAAAPHVTVALRMNATKNKRYKKGDVVGYIICIDGTDNPAMKRAYHIDELKSQEGLSVDIEYYLIYQVHAVVSRLLDVIEQIDAFRIAELLGVDGTKFKNASKAHNKFDNDNDVQVGESIKKLNPYVSCEKFKYKCLACNEVIEIDSAFRKTPTNDKVYVPTLLKCSNELCGVSLYQNINHMRNAMTVSIRTCIKRFYENWLVCDNPSCSANTRIYTHVMDNGLPVCLHCRDGHLYRQYTAGELNDQLHFYQHMFDLSQYEEKLTAKLPADIINAYSSMKKLVDQYLNHSKYCIINLRSLLTLPNEKNNYNY